MPTYICIFSFRIYLECITCSVRKIIRFLSLTLPNMLRTPATYALFMAKAPTNTYSKIYIEVDKHFVWQWTARVATYVLRCFHVKCYTASRGIGSAYWWDASIMQMREICTECVAQIWRVIRYFLERDQHIAPAYLFTVHDVAEWNGDAVFYL